VTVTGVNDAPVLTAASPSLPTISEDETSNAGQAVSDLVGASIADVDNGAVQGIAVTGATLASGHGTWQHSTDAGSSWTPIGTVSENAALLLRPEDRVRFLPDGQNGATAGLTYRAWDQTGSTAGGQGTKADVGTIGTGGTAPFSVGTDTASITVTDVNDPPVAGDDFAATDEDSVLTFGSLVGWRLATEGFEDYAADVQVEDSNGVGLNGGTGWSGAWNIADARRNDVTVVDGGLSYSNGEIVVHGGSRALQYAASEGSNVALAARQFPAQSGTLYLSFLYQQAVQVSDNDFLQVGFATSLSEPLASGLDDGAFKVRSGLSSTTGGTVSSGVPSTDAVTHLLVLRIEKTSGSTYNDVRLYVNPQYADEGLNAHTVSTANGGLNLSSAAFLALRKANTENGDRFLLDEFRIGETFESVVSDPRTLLTNDSDVDGDPLMVVEVEGSAAAVGSPIALLSGALLTVSAEGRFTYDPNGRFEYLADGETALDSFTYTASDPHGETSTATVEITVHGVNDVPVAADDFGQTDEDTVLNVSAGATYPASGLLDNDFDADTSDTLNVVAVNGIAAAVGHPISLASGAQLTVQADGSYSYNPSPALDWLDTGDTFHEVFTYTMSDRPLSLLGATVQADFNGLNPGLMNGQGGGTGFASSSTWQGTGRINVIDGDLSSPLYVLSQSGTARSVQGDFNFDTAGRQNVRPLAAAMQGEIWFSYLVQIPNTNARGGVTFNQASDSDYVPKSPRVLANGADLLLDVGGNQFAAGVFTPGQTALVVGQMIVGPGTDTIKVWVNPNLAGTGALGTPTLSNSTSNFADSIYRLGVASYHANGTLGATVDNVLLGDSLYAVTGVIEPSATVTITVTGVNDPPVAVDDHYATNEDTVVSSWPSLLANDIDPDDALAVVGIYTLDADADTYIEGTSPNTNFGTAQSLRIKHADSAFNRKAYVRFDLEGASLDHATGLADAALRMNFVDSGAGTGGTTIDWEFEVFGLADGDSGETWVEGNGGSDNSPLGEITWNNAPANDPSARNNLLGNAMSLGTFTLHGRTGVIDFRSPALTQFVRNSSDDLVTFIIRRTTVEPNTSTQSYVHAIASKEHPTANGSQLLLSFATAQGAGVLLNPDGSFRYDPTVSANLQVLAAGETVTDRFDYTLDDGEATDTATAWIEVAGISPIEVNLNLNFAHPSLPLAPGGDGNPDSVRLQLNGDRTKLQIFVNDQLFHETDAALAADETIVVTGSDDDDTLIVDFSNGNPIPTGGIHFAGGGQISGDRLVLQNGVVDSVTHTFANADSMVVISESETADFAGTTITYNQLELTLDDRLIASERTFGSNIGGEIFTLSGYTPNPIGVPQSIFTSDKHIAVAFANPAQLLTIGTAAGVDTLNVQGVDAGFDANLTIAGDSGDTVNFQTTATDIGTGNLTVNAESIKVEAAVSTGGSGVVELRATGDIVVASGGSVTAFASVTLDAGRNLILRESSVVVAGASIDLRGGQDGGGSIIDLLGTLKVVSDQGSIAVTGGDGADRVTLNPGVGHTADSTWIDGGSDDDEYHIFTGRLNGGANAVTIADSGTTGGDQAFVYGTGGDDVLTVHNNATPQTGGIVRVGTPEDASGQTLNYTPSLEFLTVDGGDGSDTFHVQPSQTIEITIVGGLPTFGDAGVPPGDTLNFDSLGNRFEILCGRIETLGGPRIPGRALLRHRESAAELERTSDRDNHPAFRFRLDARGDARGQPRIHQRAADDVVRGDVNDLRLERADERLRPRRGGDGRVRLCESAARRALAQQLADVLGRCGQRLVSGLGQDGRCELCPRPAAGGGREHRRPNWSSAWIRRPGSSSIRRSSCWSKAARWP
jgi:VCBS repeat-containing protein